MRHGRRACGPDRDRRNPSRTMLPAWRQAGEADAPLSFQQQRMYVLSRLDPTRYNYNVVEVALLKGGLDVAALSASLTAVSARHEALRSVIVEREGEPVQLVLQSPPQFERIKLKPCPRTSGSLLSGAKHSGSRNIRSTLRTRHR